MYIYIYTYTYIYIYTYTHMYKHVMIMIVIMMFIARTAAWASLTSALRGRLAAPIARRLAKTSSEVGAYRVFPHGLRIRLRRSDPLAVVNLTATVSITPESLAGQGDTVCQAQATSSKGFCTLLLMRQPPLKYTSQDCKARVSSPYNVAAGNLSHWNGTSHRRAHALEDSKLQGSGSASPV